MEIQGFTFISPFSTQIQKHEDQMESYISWYIEQFKGIFFKYQFNWHVSRHFIKPLLSCYPAELETYS